MAEIERQVHLPAAPMRAAAALASSPWRTAMRIEPVGAGSRVDIRARIEPEGLADAIEAMVLTEVCDLRSRLESELQAATQKTGTPHQPRTSSKHKTRRRTKMTTINQYVTVDAPAEQVWPALADFGGIAVWNPNVKASRLTSNQNTGEGMTRECQLSPMGTVQERVTEWNEGEMISIEIFEFKNVPAMRSALAVFNLEPHGEQTGVRMQLTYEVGLGAVGAGMNAMMMKRQFNKATTDLLAGLKYHVETGRPVERGAALPTDAVTV